MQLVLATSNKGKVREFNQLCDEVVVPYSDLIEPFEVIEDGDTFGANALIKARAIYAKLGKDALVIADDSGISVPALGNEPGIYSARYAGVGASDRDNLLKLVNSLKELGIAATPAHYTAAIAIVSSLGEYVVHGWMYGTVIDETRGEKGFGYDPMFIPEGHEKTLGELDDAIKSEISHRAKALKLARPILKLLKRRGV
jgi:XTP/dITP diphosphohydrolase